ncbi:MAG TPA: hypothetical protein VNM90_06990 [Haliangium sp.]|nr:hypothetical protein [Haliangium sp.]
MGLLAGNELPRAFTLVDTFDKFDTPRVARIWDFFGAHRRWQRGQ